MLVLQGALGVPGSFIRHPSQMSELMTANSFTGLWVYSYLQIQVFEKQQGSPAAINGLEHYGRARKSPEKGMELPLHLYVNIHENMCWYPHWPGRNLMERHVREHQNGNEALYGSLQECGHAVIPGAPQPCMYWVEPALVYIHPKQREPVREFLSQGCGF